MKNDQEFLDDMWCQIELMEVEELEKQQVLQRSRALFRRRIKIILMLVGIAMIVMISVYRYGNGVIYPGALLLLGGSFFAEKYEFQDV